MIGINFYLNIYLARNKRQDLLNSIAITLDIDNNQFSATMVGDNIVTNNISVNSISKSKPNITMGE